MSEPEKPLVDQQTRSFSPAAGESQIPSTASASAPGTTGRDSTADATKLPCPKIPGYQVHEEIARGGMGQIYTATDLVLNRRVAIKTLRPGCDAKRFITESQITACLPHPGIPPVHALGSLEEGTPFLAMKLIQGRTLQELLAERSRPAEDLPHFVQIFQQIAQAVGFAHSQGIIHRDLKPLNVMVGSFGEVQVMDWGLAKYLRADEGSEAHTEFVESSLTAFGTVMGTPGYLAPEQARGEAVDARADVFALGATLATILTGRPAIVEASVRDSIARAARGDVAEVMQRLEAAEADPELIRIAQSCLRADPKQRPADAQQVATEISTYRDRVEERLRLAELSASEAKIREAELQKRRRVWLGLAATLMIGTLVTSGLAIWANSARKAEQSAKFRAQRLQNRAELGENLAQKRLEQVEQEKRKADQQRQIAEAVRAFLQNKLLRLSDTNEQADELMRMGASSALARPDITIRELLDRAVGELTTENIEINFPNQPEVQGELLFTTGNAYLAVGSFGSAIDLLQRSADLRSKIFGRNSPEAQSALNNLGNACREAGQFLQAVAILEPLLESKQAQYDESHPDTLSTMQNLALAHSSLGQTARAISLFEKVIKLNESNPEVKIRDRLSAKQSLASAYLNAGRLDEADELIKLVLEQRRESLGQEHPTVYTTLNNLASFKQFQGEFELALQYLQEAEEGQTAKLGAEHPDTLATRNNLAIAYAESGRVDDAKVLLEEVHAIQIRTVGPEHRATLTTLNSLTHVLRLQGKLTEAIRLLRKLSAARVRVLGNEHPDTLNSMNNLGVALQDAGKIEEATEIFVQVAEMRKRNLGEEHVETLTSLNNLANIYRRQGRVDEAIELLKSVLTSRERQLGTNNPKTLTSMVNLAVSQGVAGEIDEAIELLERARIPLETQIGPDHRLTLSALNNLGRLYHQSGDLARAVELVKAVTESRERTLGENHPSTLISLNNLGRMHEDLGNVDESLEVFARMAAGVMSSELGANSILTLLGNSIRVHEHAEQWGQAEPWRRASIKMLQQEPGEQSPAYLQAMSELAFNLRQQRKWTEASQILRESLKHHESAMPEHWKTAATRMLLGKVLVETKQFEEAEQMLLQAHRELSGYGEANPAEGEEGSNVLQAQTEAAKSLRELYLATDRPKKAQDY